MTELPETLPIFPLTGAVLLPGGHLPLHIFEPRYRNMVQEALDGHQMIGMIQPFSNEAADPPEDEGHQADDPPLYEVGCAGRLEQWERFPDGRYFILLKGIARFRVVEELDLKDGFRRVRLDSDEFRVDIQDSESEMENQRLLEALVNFSETHQVELEYDKLAELPGLALLNSLAMGLPFPPEEKQALLEASDLEARHDMLLAMLAMGLQLGQDGQTPSLH